MQKNAYLILENGSVFAGKSFGYEGEAMGEVVFTTAATGYIEALTDPAYYGQMVLQTFPLIGNYGIIPSDFESDKPHLAAYIVREVCDTPSNFRCEGDLDTYLKENKIPGLCGIDTRELTKTIRENGVMKAKLTFSDDVDEKLINEIKSYSIKDAIKNVSCREDIEYKTENAKYKVVLWDLGTREGVIKDLNARGCDVVRVCAHTSAEHIKSLAPDGIVLSGGPSNPEDNPDIIEEIKKIAECKIPMFGICMGHLLLALSQGAKVFKLKYGHRGENQPALNIKTGRIYVSGQNHGYAVASDALPKNSALTYKNANDDTCEGLEYTNMPAFSVQFHPESAGGPLDTSFIIDEFISMLDKGGKDICR